MLALGWRAGISGDVGALKVRLHAYQSHFEPLGALARLLQRDIAADLDVIEVYRAKSVFVGQPNVIHFARVHTDDAAANGVERDGVVAHNDQT